MSKLIFINTLHLGPSIKNNFWYMLLFNILKELNEVVLSKPKTLDIDTVVRNNFKILIFLFATSR